jgi:sucrose phosphorylase
LQRFLASQAIMISLAGIPGVYVHSLFGSANCERCVTASGQVRSINREKFDLEKLELEINNPASRKAQIFDAYRELLRIRCNHNAFHPQGEQRIHNLGKEIFAITRVAPDKSEYILCLVNISDTTTYNAVHLPTARIQNAPVWVDLIAGGEIHIEKDNLLITLRPYQYVWLVPVNESIDK